MDFQHVDVFADAPFTGNSVTVFLGTSSLATGQMLTITREFRHFESIFLRPGTDESRWQATIFDQVQQLEFAGHPILGAAAVLHDRYGGDAMRRWTIELSARAVTVQTTRAGTMFRATLDQGRPEFGKPVSRAAAAPVLGRMGLSGADLVPGLEPAVVSAGLRYLLIPVSAPALARAAIVAGDFAESLAEVGAQYAYLLDPDGLEGRHWDNDGRAEDVATGSAAGPVGAYLVRGGRLAPNRQFTLHQGRFTGRPSQIQVEPRCSAGEITQVLVTGQVALIASGTLRSLPATAQ